jgi:hypothetical protein
MVAELLLNVLTHDAVEVTRAEPDAVAPTTYRRAGASDGLDVEVTTA